MILLVGREGRRRQMSWPWEVRRYYCKRAYLNVLQGDANEGIVDGFARIN